MKYSDVENTVGRVGIQNRAGPCLNFSLEHTSSIIRPLVIITVPTTPSPYTTTSHHPYSHAIHVKYACEMKTDGHDQRFCHQNKRSADVNCAFSVPSMPVVFRKKHSHVFLRFGSSKSMKKNCGRRTLQLELQYS